MVRCNQVLSSGESCIQPVLKASEFIFQNIKQDSGVYTDSQLTFPLTSSIYSIVVGPPLNLPPLFLNRFDWVNNKNVFLPIFCDINVSSRNDTHFLSNLYRYGNLIFGSYLRHFLDLLRYTFYCYKVYFELNLRSTPFSFLSCCRFSPIRLESSSISYASVGR